MRGGGGVRPTRTAPASLGIPTHLQRTRRLGPVPPLLPPRQPLVELRQRAERPHLVRVRVGVGVGIGLELELANPNQA